MITVAGQVAAELSKLSAAHTPEGALAVALAERIDLGAVDGPALASTSREIRMILDSVRKRPAASAGDPADELKAKRARRRRA